MFSLSNSELDVIMNLALPLDPAMRNPFLGAVAVELRRYQPEDIGPGLISRVAAVCSASSSSAAGGSFGIGKYR